VFEVQVSFTASGDVSDYQNETTRTSILSILASTAGLPVEGATLIVVSASVQITATFVVQDLAAATAAVSTFESAFGTASAATSLLTTSTFTVDVTTPPIAAATVRTVTLQPPSPPSQPLERWSSYVDLPTGCNASDTVNGSTALPGWPEECRFPDLCNITVNWSDEACENACKDLHAEMASGYVETWLAFSTFLVAWFKLNYALTPTKGFIKGSFKDKANYVTVIVGLLNAVPMSWRFFVSTTRAMSEMCLWPDPYKVGSWMALDRGGSFQVWAAAAVSPVSLQAFRQGILAPLQLWAAHFGFKKVDHRPCENLFVAMLLLCNLPSLVQAGCSVVYCIVIWILGFPMIGCVLAMLPISCITQHGTNAYMRFKHRKKELAEKPLLIQFEIQSSLTYCQRYCSGPLQTCNPEMRAAFKEMQREGKELRREMSKATITYGNLNVFSMFVLFGMPLAAFSIWSQTVSAHYGGPWGFGWLGLYMDALQETLGDRYDHFFETRLEFLFPDFFAFWNNLNITTIAGQLGLSILLDVVMLGLQMLPDWGCIGRGRNKVGASSASDPVWPVNH